MVKVSLVKKFSFVILSYNTDSKVAYLYENKEWNGN
jgi:hypothetical protein